MGRLRYPDLAIAGKRIIIQNGTQVPFFFIQKLCLTIIQNEAVRERER